MFLICFCNYVPINFTINESKRSTTYSILSIIATFLFFSYIPDYLGVIQLGPPPLNTIIIIAVLSLPFLKKVRSVPKPIWLWMGFYLGISVLSLLTVSSDEISFTDFRAKVLSCLFILLMYANFQQKSITHIRYVLIGVVLLSVINNFIELFNPRIFAAVNVGRPAGFYIDPNQAGCAIMLGTIFGITAIPKQYRWILMAISGIGIAITFSRGATIGWVICLLIMTLGKVISDRPSRIIAPAMILLLLLISIDPLPSVGARRSLIEHGRQTATTLHLAACLVRPCSSHAHKTSQNTLPPPRQRLFADNVDKQQHHGLHASLQVRHAGQPGVPD